MEIWRVRTLIYMAESYIYYHSFHVTDQYSIERTFIFISTLYPIYHLHYIITTILNIDSGGCIDWIFMVT